MSSAFIRSTIEVRHSSFSFLAATALSRIGATSTVCAGAAAGAAAADEDPPAGVAPAIVPPAGADEDPPAGVAPAVVPPTGAAVAVLLPKIPLMIFPKMLIVRSQWLEMVCVADGVRRSLGTVSTGSTAPGSRRESSEAGRTCQCDIHWSVSASDP